MYDYFLGGHHNFEIDRLAARKVIEINPDTPLVMQANRAFLRRAVRFLSERGIDQFLDIGSGIPTAGNVHEIAQKINPTARIAYVDVDPVAVRHGEALLGDNPNVAVVEADARRPELIIDHPRVRGLLDLDRPVALLLVALLHFIPDDEQARHIVAVLHNGLAPGSYVVISHATHESAPPEHVERIQKLYARTNNPAQIRSRRQIERLFDGLELIEPGLVNAPLWRPETDEDIFLDQPERSVTLAGVARKA
jgi:hypothetical protein